MRPEDIVKRQELLKAERANIEAIWEYMTRFVMPYRADLYAKPNGDGEMSLDWRKRDIYDSTAPEAADALAASLQGNLISPSVKWFDLTFQVDDLNEDDKAKEWLEECSNAIFLALQQSNFNLEAAESLLDLVGFGNMALIEEVDEDDGELDFVAVPIDEAFFEVGSKGQVLKFYRLLKWTALQLIDKFGEDGVPDAVKEAYNNPGENKKFDLIFAIYKRDTGNLRLDISKPIAKRARPVGFKYVLVDTKEELGEEGGYYEMPVMFTRWRTTSGSIWGNGPGFKVLATIMDVNEYVETVLESAAQDLEPPLMTSMRGIISDLDRRRGGLTVVQDVNAIAELPGRGDADLSVLEINDLRSAIRRAFYEDQLELKESPAMTATEVNTRYELMQRLLGPTMGRLKTDFLDKLISRTFSVLFRMGKLPPTPQIVRDKQAEFDVEYIGPLPRAQKNDQARATAGWLGQVGNLVEVYPEAIDVADWDAAIKGIGELQGVPAKFMHGKEEINDLRKARNERRAKQEKLDTLERVGDAANALGKAGQNLDANQIPALQGAVPGGA